MIIGCLIFAKECSNGYIYIKLGEFNYILGKYEHSKMDISVYFCTINEMQR